MTRTYTRACDLFTESTRINRLCEHAVLRTCRLLFNLIFLESCHTESAANRNFSHHAGKFVYPYCCRLLPPLPHSLRLCNHFAAIPFAMIINTSKTRVMINVAIFLNNTIAINCHRRFVRVKYYLYSKSSIVRNT